ncbi:8-oxo-dGTPase [Alteromonadaceae bacterium Bs31]|nr:8-oxo-dGTPase [Alteromonadaceae bacterium Bs31]
MKYLRVAVGVLLKDGKVLLAKRQEGQHLAGFWEFPGGKIEPDEQVEQALQRELMEELGVQLSSSIELLVVKHEYVDKSVELNVRVVNHFTGTAEGLEGQQIAWVNITDLEAMDFPEANIKIVEALRQRYQ